MYKSSFVHIFVQKMDRFTSN